MKAIELPERLLRVKPGHIPKGNRDINRFFNKIYEHEKNYFK